MPEDMSDRMPEDLPVTKRIVVMVGITRSKVILFFVWFSVSFEKKKRDGNVPLRKQPCNAYWFL